uniref:Uncharacterized protein n=1 Tax=Aegilops tauschii subsp. strangulata TaxID=200361 RepID=A0A453DIU2_AEGTS
ILACAPPPWLAGWAALGTPGWACWWSTRGRCHSLEREWAGGAGHASLGPRRPGRGAEAGERRGGQAAGRGGACTAVLGRGGRDAAQRLVSGAGAGRQGAGWPRARRGRKSGGADRLGADAARNGYGLMRPATTARGLHRALRSSRTPTPVAFSRPNGSWLGAC